MNSPESDSFIFVECYDYLFNATFDVPFLIESVIASAPSPLPILEWACGTGRVTIPLASAGLSVVAIDVDRRMLVRMISKARDVPCGQRIWPVMADMTKPWPIRQVRAVICAYNTLRLLRTHNGLRDFLSRAYAILPVDGRLIASLSRANLSTVGTTTVRRDIASPEGPLTLMIDREATDKGRNLKIVYTLESQRGVYSTSWHCLAFNLRELVVAARESGFQLLEVVDTESGTHVPVESEAGQYVISFQKDRAWLD